MYVEVFLARYVYTKYVLYINLIACCGVHHQVFKRTIFKVLCTKPQNYSEHWSAINH